MAKYLSNAITQRFKIEAVHNNTSQVTQNLHKGPPKVQFPCSLLAMCRGMTMIATAKSATAREIKNKFCTLRKGLYVRMAWTTKILPTIVTAMVTIMRNVSM